MKVMLRTIGFFCACYFNLYAIAQSPVSEEKWGVVLEHPGMKKVKVISDVTYFIDEKNELKLDIYLPPDVREKDNLPAIIFLPETSKNKSWEFYKTWGKLAAAYGFISITPNVDIGKYKESVQRVFSFLQTKGTHYKIDINRLGIFASGHIPDDVMAHFLNESALTGVKAVALYYTPPSVKSLIRKDLPVLYVADDQVNPSDTRYTSLWNEIQKSKAPWNIKYCTNMPPCFDVYTDTDESRRVIRETIYFWKNYLEPIPSPSWDHSEEREMIAALYSRDEEKTKALFKSWLEKNPTDQYANLRYGVMMLNANDFSEAEKAYRNLQNVPPDYLINFGKILYATGKSEEAKQLISKAVIRPNTYSGIGRFLYSLGNYQEGISYFEKSLAIQIRGADFYNLACGYTKLNNIDRAFENLNKAAENGYNSKKQYEDDPDLEFLHPHARWKELIMKLKD